MKDSATRVFLIRHGETANAAQRRYNGHFDADLSERGISQIEALAEQLKDAPIKAVYSSDLQRSQKGARCIAGKHRIEVCSKKELREINYGRWEGLAYDEIKERYSDEARERYADIVNYAIKGGGESLLEFSQRVIPAVREIVSKHKDETIVMLLHGGVNKVILSRALHIDLTHIYRIKQDFAAFNIIGFFENSEEIVELMNYTSLPIQA